MLGLVCRWLEDWEVKEVEEGGKSIGFAVSWLRCGWLG